MINTSTLAVNSPGPGATPAEAAPETVLVEGTDAYVAGWCGGGL